MNASSVIRSARVLLLGFCLLPALALAEVPVPPVVAVPFGCGLDFQVTQVHAVGTHVDNDVWAWDFRMPAGTPVVAVLDGVVRLARGDSTEGGCDPSMAPTANYVVLEHDGGLESQYLHFSRVVVRPGQHVRQGELLGYSGATGWACGPHLHFKMARPESDGWNNPSVAARIAGYGDPALGTLVSSPPCAAPSVIAGNTPAAAPVAREGGALLRAALSTAPSSATPAPVHVLVSGPNGSTESTAAPASARSRVVPAIVPAPAVQGREAGPVHTTPSAAPPATPGPTAASGHVAS